MADYYVKSGSALPFNNDTVATARAYSLGEKMVPRRGDATANNGIAKGYVWEVTTAGTSGTTDPTWPASVTPNTTTVTSGTVTFTARAQGFNGQGVADWAFSTIYLEYAGLSATNAADGDARVYVSVNHTENLNGTTFSAPGNNTRILCVSDTVAPPTALAVMADTAAGLVASGGGAYDFNANVYVRGLTFTGGTGTGAGGGFRVGANLANQSFRVTFDNCCIRLLNTSNNAANRIQVGLTNAAQGGNQRVEFLGCRFRTASTTQVPFATQGATLIIKDLRNADGATVFPASGLLLSQQQATARGYAEISGCDFSSYGQGLNIFNPLGGQKLIIRNSKLPANWTGSLSAVSPIPNGVVLEMHNCDSAGVQHRLRIESNTGVQDTTTAIYRQGGASDGTTPISWRAVTGADARFPHRPLDTAEIAQFVTAGAKTLTLHILSETTLTTNDVAVELQYPADANSPMTDFIDTKPANFLAAAAPHPNGDASGWVSGLGTPVAQKIDLPFTALRDGYVQAIVRVYRPSTTVYIDPKLVIA